MTRPGLGQRQALTHKGNLRASRYGWLRLTPMYSIHAVAEVLDSPRVDASHVLDPFCGTGTTALVCAERGIPCDTTDINPFLIWLTEAKTHAYVERDAVAAVQGSERVATAILDESAGLDWTPALKNIEKWWDEIALGALSRAWASIGGLEATVGTPARDLLAIAFLRTAIRTAHVSFGHQSMSFKRPNGNGDQQLIAEVSEAEWVRREWTGTVSSIAAAALSPITCEPRVVQCDARRLAQNLPNDAYTCVVTSPPYCNRMSYIRELRPYMYWMGYLSDGRAAGEMDWQAIGGTWGMATSRVATWEPGERTPIPFVAFEGILEQVAQQSPLLSRYIAKYFHDVVEHVRDLANVVSPGGTVHYIIGNSKFYDVLVPAQDVYAAVFSAEGFEDVRITTLRKRTSKKELFEYMVEARRPQ